MPENQIPNRSPRKPTEAWRVERMVQRVPGHIGEEPNFSPWLVVGAVSVVVVVGALLLFISGFPGTAFAPASIQQTTPTPKPRQTIIIRTATVGNTPTPTPRPTVPVVKYTVKKGDTLSTIAQKYKVTVEAIRAANNMTDDTIHIGDVLNIPQPPAATPPALSEATDAPPGTGGNPQPSLRTPTLIAFIPTSTPALPTTPTATPGVVLYTVKSGDTLIGIAAVFSTTVQSLLDINRLNGPSIRAGDTISVPIGAWTATPTATSIAPATTTPTPQFAYPAPELLSPSDGADIAHGDPVPFQWLSVGVLNSGEFYVLHLHDITGGADYIYQIDPDQGNTYNLAAFPLNANGPTQFSWYVVVVRGGGCGPVAPAAVQPCAVSPVSSPRTFIWR